MLISLRLIYKISMAEFLLKSEKKRPVNKVEDSLGKLLYLLWCYSNFHDIWKPSLYIDMVEALTNGRLHLESLSGRWVHFPGHRGCNT